MWTELCRIPYGETISYLELANRIRNPKAVRAVGMANGANPIAIIVPCHRVIGSNGSLTGFGGGIPTRPKRDLLPFYVSGKSSGRFTYVNGKRGAGPFTLGLCEEFPGASFWPPAARPLARCP
ncbi:MAG: MGMT family protein [Acidobacteria bacterium]|nr:MGMT family protein [Acidobacteriota bacterium]MSO82992.1 MGMT family protein [Acidobacteriota bacterium]